MNARFIELWSHNDIAEIHFLESNFILRRPKEVNFLYIKKIATMFIKKDFKRRAKLKKLEVI